MCITEQHCTYENDAMYFFEDYTLWSAVTAVGRLLGGEVASVKF